MIVFVACVAEHFRKTNNIAQADCRGVLDCTAFLLVVTHVALTVLAG